MDMKKKFSAERQPGDEIYFWSTIKGKYKCTKYKLIKEYDNKLYLKKTVMGLTWFQPEIEMKLRPATNAISQSLVAKDSKYE